MEKLKRRIIEERQKRRVHAAAAAARHKDYGTPPLPGQFCHLSDAMEVGKSKRFHHLYVRVTHAFHSVCAGRQVPSGGA
eukprot:COSAG01_NODE_2237_length_8089_cov_65.213767_5_plen_79_part_00